MARWQIGPLTGQSGHPGLALQLHQVVAQISQAILEVAALAGIQTLPQFDKEFGDPRAHLPPRLGQFRWQPTAQSKGGLLKMGQQ